MTVILDRNRHQIYKVNVQEVSDDDQIICPLRKRPDKVTTKSLVWYLAYLHNRRQLDFSINKYLYSQAKALMQEYRDEDILSAMEKAADVANHPFTFKFVSNIMRGE